MEETEAMKCKILHETSGRMRVRLLCGPMSLSDADTLEYWLRATDGVDTVKVYDRTRDAVVTYHGALCGVLLRKGGGGGPRARAHHPSAEPRI